MSNPVPTPETIKKIGDLLDPLYADEHLRFSPVAHYFQVNPPRYVRAKETQIERRVFITLTFAQTSDGKIAGKDGKQLRISGQESMQLTHCLRFLHDSIVVGVGTVINDDPQLTARFINTFKLTYQPIPVILDPKLKTPVSCKLIQNPKSQPPTGRTPIIICSPYDQLSEEEQKRFKTLKQSGPMLIQCPLRNGKFSFADIRAIPELGKSIMIEGGATVITDLLTSPDLVELVDEVIITTSSIIAGEGVDAIKPEKAGENKLNQFEVYKTIELGEDKITVYHSNKV